MLFYIIFSGGNLTNFRKIWSKRAKNSLFKCKWGGGMSEIWKFCQNWQKFNLGGFAPPPPEKVNFRHCCSMQSSYNIHIVYVFIQQSQFDGIAHVVIIVVHVPLLNGILAMWLTLFNNDWNSFSKNWTINSIQISKKLHCTALRKFYYTSLGISRI
jgi:hypothetical protein